MKEEQSIIGFSLGCIKFNPFTEGSKLGNTRVLIIGPGAQQFLVGAVRRSKTAGTSSPGSTTSKRKGIKSFRTIPSRKEKGGREGGADNGTPAIHRGAGPTTRSSAAKMAGVVIAPSGATALVTDTTVTACGHQWCSFNTGGGNCS